MSSASTYINRRRVLVEASITKVQYPGKIENKNPLLPVRNCYPNYSVLRYSVRRCCRFISEPEPVTGLGCILDAGNYDTEATIILDGGSSTTNATFILDGISYCVSGILEGGNSSSEFSQILDGGNALTESTNVLDGGN